MEKINWGSTESTQKYNILKFQEFLQQTPEQIKSACLDKNNRLKHILRAEHFDLKFLKTICDTTNAARRIAKLENNYLKKLLRSKSILNYFHQPSSRTFLSFSTAESHLGMRREELRNLKTSSTAKGESDRDSLRTISSYFNAIVIRHPSDYYDLFSLWVMKNSDREIPLINAGSGTKEHPTQGILDYYTIRESFDGNVDDLTVTFVGDCKRGRTVHSLAKILALHNNITIYFVAPESLQIDEETERYIKDKGVIVHKVTDGLKSVVPRSKVIYMTRIQNEYGGSSKYDQNFVFTKECLEIMQSNAILMHPLPKREEIDSIIDEFRRDRRVMYWRQMRNGMWTRVALLAYLFGKDRKIIENYENSKKINAPKPL
jgi:aspartate carbamoyltransferase catalytic subunit